MRLELGKFLVNSFTNIEGIQATVCSKLIPYAIRAFKEDGKILVKFGKIVSWDDSGVELKLFKPGKTTFERECKSLTSLEAYLTYLSLLPEEKQEELKLESINLLVDLIGG